LWVGARREHWMRKPRVHAYVRDTALFFWPLAQIPGAARIRLSHNHLGPQINGLLLRAASRSSGWVSVTNTQTDTTFALIYRILHSGRGTHP
jgi:hypothetical protein